MSLENYFAGIIEQVENSDIDNQGKDDNGFFKPTRSILLQKLNMLKDLHGKPGARPMVKAAWEYISLNLPPEWLVISGEQKIELKRILDGDESK